MTKLRREACISIAVLLLTASACTPEADIEPQPDVVRAVWDPASGELPSPTDLVRDDARDNGRGRLDLPIDREAPAADREFTAYLNSLDGFPLASTIKIPVSDEVQAAGLGGSFFVLDAQTGEPLSLERGFDAEAGVITATPRAGDDDAQRATELAPGQTYVFGLRGYEGGLRGAYGEPVIADAGFYMVRSEEPLIEHPDAMPGDSSAEKTAAAEALHEIQQAYAPLIDMVTERRGFGRSELAVLSTFTTTDKPAVWFDPNTGRIPMPNDVLMDRETGLVDLPIADDETGEVRDVKETLSEYDGFSASAALVLESTHPVESTTVLDEEAVRLFRRTDSGELVEVTDLERGVLDDGKTFWIRPRLTLEANSEYVYVATRALEDRRGEPLQAQPLGALIRSKATLVDGDTSQVSAIDDATAQMLEPVRQKAEAVLDRLDGELHPRESVPAAVPFRTLSAAERMLEYRAKLYEQDVRTDIQNVEVASPFDRGLFVAMPRVKTVVSGEMFVLDHLDPQTRRFHPDGSAQEKPASFVLTIPRGIDRGKPIPVVLFGHGLMTSRELVYLIADKLASEGYASFALDLPYHGHRAVCVEDTDCKSNDATCSQAGECIESDGSTGEIATIEVPFVDAEYPVSTGFAFVEVGNLVGTRDHFAQAALDLMQGLRVIRGADWAGQADGWVLDGGDVSYLGMSLGGIVGSILSATEPTLDNFVLNVPGADYFTLIEESATFSGEFQHALDERGVEQGSDAYFDFENVVRWLLDPIDPLNLVQHTIDDPLTYTDPTDGQQKTAPAKRVLIQMAENDSVVPNAATEILAERMGVDISTYTPAISNHGFLFDPTSFEGRDARNEMVEFLNAR